MWSLVLVACGSQVRDDRPVVPPAPVPEPIEPASCQVDADCDWVNPCSPKACAAAKPRDQVCDRQVPPGRCGCAAGTCTMLKGATGVRSTVSCAADADCGFDPVHGACVAGGPSADDPGVGCVCDTLNAKCVQTWTGEVACDADHDCSWQHVGGKERIPVPSFFIRRDKETVRPCEDRAFDSVCRNQRCEIVDFEC